MRQAKGRRQQMVGGETQVDLAELVVAAQQQARSRQQHQGYRKLTDHKNGPQARMTAACAGGAAALFEGIVYAGTRGRIGGSTPHARPVRTAIEAAKKTTPQSSPIELTRGKDSGRKLMPTRNAESANAEPNSPPMTLSSMDSSKLCRSTAAPFAPSARRTAISRRRRMTRTNSKPARLAHAINSTTATARKSVFDQRPRRCNRRSSTIARRSRGCEGWPSQGKRPRGLLRHALRILLCLLCRDAGLQPPDHFVVPASGLYKVARGKAQGHPELAAVELPGTSGNSNSRGITPMIWYGLRSSRMVWPSARGSLCRRLCHIW